MIHKCERIHDFWFVFLLNNSTKQGIRYLKENWLKKVKEVYP